MGRPKKFDYDSQDFYDRIAALAMQGMTDAEIAVNLSVSEGGSLSPEVFCKMKNGCYDKWSKSENKRRSEKLVQVLAHARNRINSIVRGAYLKSALGGKKIKSKTVITRKLKFGESETGGEEIQTSETESELPPNLQALSTWLYHHDLEWRKVERKQEEDNNLYSENGINIDKWMEENESED